MNKKRLLGVVSAAVMLLALAGAAMAPAVFELPPAQWQQEDTREEEAAIRLTSADYEELALGEDVFSFGVRLAGQSLVLPCEAGRLGAYGWETDAPWDEVFLAQQCTELVFYKGGARLAAQIANMSQREAELQDCTLVGLVLERDEAAQAEPELAGGIAFGMSREEILALCGQPNTEWMPAQEDGEQAKEDGSELYYATGRNAHIAFALDAEGALCKMELYNRRETGNLPDPEELAFEALSYRTPEDLGDSWDSFNILYAGDSYSLPAPVQSFLVNGWTLRDEATVPAGGWVKGVCLQKGNHVLRTRLQNFTKEEQPLTSCFVTMVESSRTSMDVELLLGGGISRESSLEEIVAAYGYPHKVYQNGTSLDYTYYSENGRLWISFTPDTWELFDLELWYADSY